MILLRGDEMDINILSEKLRESTRLLIRTLGVLEQGGAVCCGITYAQCHALVETGRKEKLSVNELAELLNLDKSTVSKTVEQLVKNGVILREPSTRDRRYVDLRLTKAGQELFQSIETRMKAYFTNILNGIPKEKHEQVIESMQLLSESLKGIEHR